MAIVAATLPAQRFGLPPPFYVSLFGILGLG